MTHPALASILERYPARREFVIPILQGVQETLGYLSPDALRLVSRRLRISENDIYGVATFYAQFRFHPPGRNSIHVCLGTACHVRGGAQLSSSLEYRLGIGPGETTADRKYELHHVACLGCCALAPVVKMNDRIYSQMSVLKLGKVMDEYDQAD